MLRKADVQKLLHDMHRELNAAPRSLMVCALGLTALILLVTFGTRSSDGEPQSTVTRNVTSQRSVSR